MYGAELWGPSATKSQVEVLQSSQNKLLRWICQTKTIGGMERDRKACNLLSVNQIIVLRVISLGLNVIHIKKP